MSNNKASLKNTFGTVLGAVTSAAGSISSLFETTNLAIGMGHKAVATASEKQAISTDYDLAAYEENLHKSVAIDQARQNSEIKAFLTERPENADLFKSSFDNIAELVAARRKARGL